MNYLLYSVFSQFSGGTDFYIYTRILSLEYNSDTFYHLFWDPDQGTLSNEQSFTWPRSAKMQNPYGQSLNWPRAL
jgi:hypothetical protein